jgi:endonuclease/exonuclease/phosphatase family metal-dependent hydrolase
MINSINIVMLSILTINTWKSDGNYSNRIKALVKELKKMKPDIILLQEALQTNHCNYNTALSISQALNYNYYTTLSRYKMRIVEGVEMLSYSNQAIVSVMPVNFEKNLELPTHEKDGDRHAQLISFRYGEKNILIINIHLTYLKDASDIRKKQLEYIVNNICEYKYHDAILIGGDFNCRIDEAIEGLNNNDFLAKDTFFKNSGGIDYTMSGLKGNYKIDHIIQLLPQSLEELPIISSEVVFENFDKEYNVKISDHNGVLCKISI